VRRDAQRRGKAAIALRGRGAALRQDVLLRDLVELEHRDPRLEPLADERDRLGDERSGLRHLLDLVRALANDHAGASTSSSASWISAKTSSSEPRAWIPTTLPVVR